MAIRADVTLENAGHRAVVRRGHGTEADIRRTTVSGLVDTGAAASGRENPVIVLARHAVRLAVRSTAAAFGGYLGSGTRSTDDEVP